MNNYFEIARILSYGVLVPALYFIAIMRYRRSVIMFLFCACQSCVYLALLIMLVIEHRPVGSEQFWEPYYSTFVVIQAILAVILAIRDWKAHNRISKLYCGFDGD